MSTVKELTNTRYDKVGVFRNAFPLARYFFDLHVSDDGIAAYFMWRRNMFRFPIIHHIRDFMVRNKREGMNRQQAVELDDRNFYIAFDDIQGVVTDRDHKEIQILSKQEQLRFLFRPYEDYDEFVETLKDKIGERYFTRDDIEIEDSVYV